MLHKLKREGYFQCMNKYDLQARGVQSTGAALVQFMNGVRKPNSKEASILSKAIKKADSFIPNESRLASIPWKLLISNDHIESGFPHTHADMIIIPNSHVISAASRIDNLVHTLIHEKVHVYQRMYPCESNTLYLKYWRMSIGARINCNSILPSRRSNPDTNMLVYLDEKGKSIHLNFDTSSSHSVSLSKTIGDPRDHPHEIMAYVVTHLLTHNASHIQSYHQRYIDSASAWMSIYL